MYVKQMRNVKQKSKVGKKVQNKRRSIGTKSSASTP